MTISDDVRVGALVTVKPSIYVGAAGTPLAAEAEDLMQEVIVDNHLHLPDMFEISFFDNQANAVSTAGMSIGTAVEVWAGSPATGSATQLIAGEVTAIEGRYESRMNHTVVRGYSKEHRMQRTRRNRTFLNMKDSDIARQVASDAGLTVGTIDETKATHDHVGQVNQTDWDFLTWRAADIGYEIGMSEGKFYFRKASSTTTATGTPVTLTFPTNLRAFAPRVTAGNLAQEAEVRVWDPLAAKVVIAKQAASTGSVKLSKDDASTIAGQFAGVSAPPAPEENNAALGDLGPAPSDKGFVASRGPLAVGSAISSAADEVIAGLAEQANSTFAEAQGEAVGDPHLKAGAVVSIAGVPDPFAGDWVITNARHEFSSYYHTVFEVSGRHTRSLLGLASGGDRPAPALVEGVACGIVSNINDPQSKGRVKVVLPWLSPQFESDWGSVVQFGAGKRSGGMFMPEVGDEVLVAFEFGDPRRPYVLGGIVNNNTTYTAGGPAVQAQGETASVIRRGIVAASGNMLAFHDEMPPGDDAKPTASQFTLGTSDGTVGFVVDVVQGTLTIACTGMDDAPGTVNIKCNDAGQINIQAGEGGTVTVDGGGTLNLKAQEQISISSQGEVQIQGQVIKLN